ncbi:stage III sporulation protein AF [Lachnospiraceae bacterium MD308]|nr:stage III sporulation protein AF [Lachnospiraceae bacterium MD308]MCI8580870.1 stage III sporulation protein AF [Dorea sp.]
MFRYFYEWAQNLAFYMVLVTVVLHAVPDSGYKKYIRFFTGMVLILMILTPIFKIFGMDSQIVNFYKSREYEAKLQEIEEATDYLKDIDSPGMLEETLKNTGPQETSEGDYAKGQEGNSIKVEEIQIEGKKEAD